MSPPVSGNTSTPSNNLLPQFLIGNGSLARNAPVNFSQDLRGQDPHALDAEMALLAQDVYEPKGKPIGESNWVQLTDAELEDANINPELLSNDSSGFQAAVYRNDDGNVTVAFAGTDMTSIPDWLNNLGQGMGFETAQYNQAVELAQEVTQAFPGEVAFTGHSLGGGLASAAALKTNAPGVTFNAAGLSDQTLRNLDMNPNAARAQAASEGQIRRYTVENDILTGLQSGVSPLPEAVGHQLQLENTYLIQDPVRAHLMDAVLNGMAAGDPVAVERDPLTDAVARPGEVVFDLLGQGVREGIDYGADVVEAAGTLVEGFGEAIDNLANNRPTDAVVSLVGDVADAGLQVIGGGADHTLNLAGDVVQGSGTLIGGWFRDLGRAVGLEGTGNTIGGWVEGATSWVDGALDTAGDWIDGGLSTAGGWLNSGFSAAGDGLQAASNWIGDRVDAVRESKWNPRNWF